MASWMPAGDSHFMWLRDYLPCKYPKVRTIIYGYDTRVPESQSEQLSQELGCSLAQSLSASGLLRPAASRLVFIVHSLGGIVLKHALVHMAQAKNDYSSMLRSVERVMLFGVPTQGMRIDHLLSMVQEGLQPNESLIRQLDPGDRRLAEVYGEFSRICKDKQIRIISIYERERTRVSKVRLVAGLQFVIKADKYNRKLMVIGNVGLVILICLSPSTPLYIICLPLQTAWPSTKTTQQ